MNRPIETPTFGGLDKDSDLQYIKANEGDYPELIDMEFTEENVGAATTAIGNTQKIDFGTVQKQNQKIRAYWDGVNQPTNIAATLKNINGQTLGFGSKVTDGSLIGFRFAINQIFTEFAIPGVVTIYPDKDYVDVEVAILYSPWEVVAEGFTYSIIQEAIASDGEGEYMPIGSFDLFGDIFFWVTTQRNIKSEIKQGVHAAIGTGFGQTIVTIPFHGLEDYQTIAINGVVGCDGVNGIWVVEKIDNNRVLLVGSLFSGTYVSGGTVFKDLYGYGCIGVAKPDLFGETYQFTPLLRSKKLNFCTKREIYAPLVQKEGDFVSMYYADNQNPPRVTYYRGDYIPDGCIQALNQQGVYRYETLNEAIQLQANFSTYRLEFVSQPQQSGNLPSGNKRYAVRMITSEGTATEVSLLTNPIPVYQPQYLNDTDKIYGNPSGTDTGKINKLRLSGILPGVFKYVELLCFDYLGDNLTAVSATIVRRESLSPNQTEIELEHNGAEVGVVNFDAGLANAVRPDIVRSRDLTVVQNRIVLGNVSSNREFDLTEFAKTLKYSIKRFPIYGAYGAQTFYEFYDPEKTAENVGYQQWEWYRYYIVGELKSGSMTQSFFLFDVRFVSQDDYTGEYGYEEFISTNGTDRRDLSDDDFTNYDLGQGDREYLQYFIRVSGFDWNYQIDGVPIKDLFRSFKIYRAERIPEVLYSGVLNLAFKGISGSVVELVDYPFAIANTIDTNQPVPYPTTYPPNPAPQRRKYGSFYSPDQMFSASPLEYVIGDKIICLGNQRVLQNLSGKTSDFYINSSSRIFAGINGTTKSDFHSVVKVVDVKANTAIAINPFTSYSKEAQTISFSGGGYGFTSTGMSQGSPVLELTTDVQNNSAEVDYGIYQALYFRKVNNKYGNTTANNVVIDTVASCSLSETFCDVYGGDVFTQQTWVKRSVAKQSNPNKGGGSGFNLISQNRINTNLRLWDSTDNTQLVYPLSTRDFVAWLESPVLDTQMHSASYNIANQVQARNVYDPEIQNTNDFVSRKWYSELKPNGSKVDFYRIFLPLNFQDNPIVNGEISRVLNVNNELFTVQRRGYTREYFNSRGQLASQDSGQVLIGDGSVLSRVGNDLSDFGTNNAGAVVVGKSQSGKDVVMYVSPEYGQVMRFGDDGLVSVSLRKKMRTFFNNNLKWAINANTPADGYGITGVWDNRNKQFIFTVKAWKPVDQWKPSVTYSRGNAVVYGFVAQGIPAIWELAAEQSKGVVPVDESDWKAIPITDNRYYNAYTFTWNEAKASFTQFYSYLPNLYAPVANGFMTGLSDLNSTEKNTMWMHGIGEYANFYGTEFYGGKISVICNFMRNMNKKFFAIMINGEGKPAHVGISTLFRDNDSDSVIKKSYLESSDFDTREGYSYSPIKLEIDETGSNDGDTGIMEGIWARFDIVYPKGKKSSINSFITRVRDSARNFTR